MIMQTIQYQNFKPITHPTESSKLKKIFAHFGNNVIHLWTMKTFSTNNWWWMIEQQDVGS